MSMIAIQRMSMRTGSRTHTGPVKTPMVWRSTLTITSAMFAGVGLLLAAIGLFGLASVMAVRRTKEFGIRLAIGASPRQVRRLILRAGRWLDAFGLLPRAMIEADPMYASAFVANLGSVGLDAAYHHLFEHGTAPIFVTMGRLHKAPVVAADGSVVAREIFELKWTFDERTEDGFYAARGLGHLKELLENPDRLA